MGEVFVAGFVVLIYVPVTVIYWRNVKLSQPWKAIFCLTICPVFVVAILFNIAFTNRYAGWLLDDLASAKAHGWVQSEGSSAFMVSVPIALVICLAWYGVIRACDYLTNKIKRDVTT